MVPPFCSNLTANDEPLRLRFLQRMDEYVHDSGSLESLSLFLARVLATEEIDFGSCLPLRLKRQDKKERWIRP